MVAARPVERTAPARRHGARLPALADDRIVAHIAAQSALHGIDNITRTRAYERFLQANAEVHWALLAAIVSRNTGFLMTDLRGEPLADLIASHDARAMFLMLERCNWLIFHDAYPQLLLYELTKRLARPLFHLLPALGFSAHMAAHWHAFARTRDSQRITLALIVNEQNYIQRRVVEHERYGRALRAPAFALAELAGLIRITMPDWSEKDRAGTPRLAGRRVAGFASLERRIEIGRQLYRLLYPDGSPREGVIAWLRAVPDPSGSRADYWPAAFVADEASGPLAGPARGSIRPRTFRSPTLRSVWPTIHHEPAGDAAPPEDALMRRHTSPVIIVPDTDQSAAMRRRLFWLDWLRRRYRAGRLGAGAPAVTEPA